MTLGSAPPVPGAAASTGRQPAVRTCLELGLEPGNEIRFQQAPLAATGMGSAGA